MLQQEAADEPVHCIWSLEVHVTALGRSLKRFTLHFKHVTHNQTRALSSSSGHMAFGFPLEPAWPEAWPLPAPQAPVQDAAGVGRLVVVSKSWSRLPGRGGRPRAAGQGASSTSLLLNRRLQPAVGTQSRGLAFQPGMASVYWSGQK